MCIAIATSGVCLLRRMGLIPLTPCTTIALATSQTLTDVEYALLVKRRELAEV